MASTANESADGAAAALDLNQRQVHGRRNFISASSRVLAAAGTAAGIVQSAHAAEPESWKSAGGDFSNYGVPGADQQDVIRWISANPAVPGEGVSWSPLHELEGSITPNGLHFERHHNGVPRVDTDSWSLQLRGKVRQPLAFDLGSLHRYPLVSRISFIECGGNSNALWHERPMQAAAGHLHGLVSGSEWTGVPLAVLLGEAGLLDDAKWLIADGLDASGVTVSIPLHKCMDDVIVAIYQNGEAIRPENGYPARLLVPGWEGIVNVKWLHSLTLSDKPLWSRFDTVSYTDLQKDGSAQRMTFEMGVKSVITSPSPGHQLAGAGVYQISGLAWSGAGMVKKVEVSADGGQQWTAAELQAPVLDKALTRFRIPWQWNGEPRVLLSRATDSKGHTQPARIELIRAKGHNVYHHYNAVNSWLIAADGSVSHVYI